MSHSVNIATEFKNMKTLLKQFEQAGWSILTNTKANTYPSDPRREEIHKYVAKNPKVNGYDIGINTDAKGNAGVVCDFFDASIERQLGKNLTNIKKGYALAEVKRMLRNEDMSCKVTELESGELVVVAEK